MIHHAGRAYLIDDRPYSVVCEGIRYLSASESDARDKAEELFREWALWGLHRPARIYYRDGTLLATAPSI